MHIHTQAGPLAIIVDDEILNRTFVAAVLRAAGWRVVTAADGATALVLLEQSPSLILVDLHMPGMSGIDTVAAIRRRADLHADVAILAYTTTPQSLRGALYARGFDGVIAKPCTPDEMTRMAARWRPHDAAPVLTRLEQGLGPVQMRGLTRRFRSLLIGALAEADADADGGAKVGMVAHRIAGIAGTLGFAALGEAWLALSLGDESARVAARREARLAIMAIDQHLKS